MVMVTMVTITIVIVSSSSSLLSAVRVVEVIMKSFNEWINLARDNFAREKL